MTIEEKLKDVFDRSLTKPRCSQWENKMANRLIHFSFLLLFQLGCTTIPKFDESLVRPWQTELNREAPSRRPYIAHHKVGRTELFYFAAHHDNDPNSDTIKLVERLFKEFKFEAVIIEPIANSFGVSPDWFVKDSREGAAVSFVKGGESAVAAIRADERKLPFFGGEIDHKQLFEELKTQSFTDEDILGFYLVRQIPQWIRQKENAKGLLEKKGPGFISHYCKTFEIESAKCPSLDQLKAWYQKKNLKKLDINVTTEDVAPRVDGELFTHKVSSAIGIIRDRFTLDIIDAALKKYKKVAVVYGTSHYLTLRKSLEASLGEPQQIILPNEPIIQSRDLTDQTEFKKLLDEAISDVLYFSEKENLQVNNVQAFVAKVVLYGSKTDFDKMISTAPNWPKATAVPKNYVGMGDNKTLHIVSWESYKTIHPEDTIEDYKKLLTHELAHLLHIAFLEGREDDMGPMWFFEGFACLVADQYPDSKLPNSARIREVLNAPERGNYKDYVSIMRKLNERKSVLDLLRDAKKANFTSQSMKFLR